jgi:hypothetical protein
VQKATTSAAAAMAETSAAAVVKVDGGNQKAVHKDKQTKNKQVGKVVQKKKVQGSSKAVGCGKVVQKGCSKCRYSKNGCARCK